MKLSGLTIGVFRVQSTRAYHICERKCMVCVFKDHQSAWYVKIIPFPSTKCDLIHTTDDPSSNLCLNRYRVRLWLCGIRCDHRHFDGCSIGRVFTLIDSFFLPLRM